MKRRVITAAALLVAPTPAAATPEEFTTRAHEWSASPPVVTSTTPATNERRVEPRRATRPKPRGVRAAWHALRELGVRYTWGGETHRVGFDCSGLVQHAWARVGVHLPRTTYTQINVGRAIRRVRDLRPGDLVFPSRGHVQMYVGRGRVVESPRRGLVVRVSRLRNYHIALRRPVPAR